MRLLPLEYGWNLAMEDCRLQLIEIDFRLSLLFVDGGATARLHVETVCRLCCQGEEKTLDPNETSSLAPILSLFNMNVLNIQIRKHGTLTVSFSNGDTLDVHSDNNYEAWQITSDLGLMFVCCPGGEVSFFRQEVAQGDCAKIG